MADNFPLTPGSGRSAATDQVTHSGDSADVQLVRPVLTTGAEGSKTVVDLTGDNTNGLDVDVTRVGGDVTVVQPTAANLNVRVENVTGTVSLPTGAATAAKQPALGTAGTASADVITVQGVASMTPLQVSDGGGTLTVDGTVAATQSGAWTVTGSGGTFPVTDSGGSLTVDAPVGTPAFVRLSDGSAAITTLPVSLASVPSHAVTNAGTFAVQVTSLPASTNTVEVVGDAAENAAVAGNPVLTGGRYDSSPRTLGNGDVGAVALNASGQMLVEIAAGAGSGGTAAADGATFTRNTTSVTPAGAVVESSAPTLNNGDVAGLSQDTAGNLRVRVDAGGIAGAVVDSVAGATDEGVLAVLVRDDALATLTPADGDYTQGRTNARGALWVALDSTAAQNVTVAAALPAGTNNIGDVDVLTLPNVTLAAGTNTNEVVGDAAIDAAIAGNPVLIGGRASTATPSAMSADNDAQALWLTREGAAVTVGAILDDAVFTPGTSRVQPVGFTADESSTDSVDEGDIGAARITLDRKQIVTPYVHAAAGGATPYYNLDVDESEDAVKASAGKVFWLHAMNLSNAKRYLKLYNDTTANVTVGTTTPVLSLPIPTMADTNGCGFTINFGDIGVQFTAAITIAATTGFADNDTGAPGANEIIVNLGYA
jgi:hypothetical protein